MLGRHFLLGIYFVRMREMKHIKRLTSKWELLFHLPKLMMAILALFFISSCSNNQSSWSLLKKKQFVLVENGDPSYKEFVVGFDLKEQEFYNNAQTVVKDDTVYGGYNVDRDRNKYFSSAVNNELSSVLLSKKITTDEIKKSNYQITSSPKRFVDDKLMKEEYPPEFEAIYLKKNRQFSKVRITYNNELLPTKIEWYYKGEEGLKWYTWRTYSYPFKNKSDFDKKLDEQIQLIKDIESEKEED